MNLVHIEQTQTCSICGKISPNRKALRDHKKIHIESTKDRFKCIVCGKGFRHSTKLRVSKAKFNSGLSIEISN